MKRGRLCWFILGSTVLQIPLMENRIVLPKTRGQVTARSPECLENLRFLPDPRCLKFQKSGTGREGIYKSRRESDLKAKLCSAGKTTAKASWHPWGRNSRRGSGRRDSRACNHARSGTGCSKPWRIGKSDFLIRSQVHVRTHVSEIVVWENWHYIIKLRKSERKTGSFIQFLLVLRQPTDNSIKFNLVEEWTR